MDSKYVLSRNLTRFVWGVFGLCAFVSVAFAQPTALVSQLPENKHPGLLKLLKAALSQSPTVLSGNLDVAFSEAQAIGDNSQRFPQVGLNGNFGIQSSSTSDGPHSEKTGFYYNVSVTQALYHWGAIDAQREVGKMRVAVAAHRNADAYRTLANSVRSQYLKLIEKKIQVKAALFALKRGETQVNDLEERFKLGAIAQAELTEPRMALDENRVVTERIVQDYEQSRRVLARVCGIDSVPDEDIADQPAKVDLSTEEVNLALEQSKAFDPSTTEIAQMYQMTIQQSEKEYFVATRRLYPMINLSLSSNQQNNTTPNGKGVSQTSITQHSAFVQADWRIFDGFATRSAKQVALTQKRQAERNLKNTVDRVSDEAAVLAKSINLASRAMTLSEVRLGIAEGTIKRMEEDAKLGQIPKDNVTEFVRVVTGVQLMAYANRTEFYNRVAELVSLQNADPLLAHLSTSQLDGQR